MTCRVTMLVGAVLAALLVALAGGPGTATAAPVPARVTPAATAATVAVTASAASAASTLDRRCRTGRVICVDKSERTLRWVVRGTVRMTMAARFGARSTPTREGTFTVFRKSRDHVSSIYHTPMPFAMFFSGGQAVHYSSDFARRGYAGASHGCVNVRDRAKVRSLFDQVRVGDRVVVSR